MATRTHYNWAASQSAAEILLVRLLGHVESPIFIMQRDILLSYEPTTLTDPGAINMRLRSFANELRMLALKQLMHKWTEIKHGYKRDVLEEYDFPSHVSILWSWYAGRVDKTLYSFLPELINSLWPHIQDKDKLIPTTPVLLGKIDILVEDSIRNIKDKGFDMHNKYLQVTTGAQGGEFISIKKTNGTAVTVYTADGQEKIIGANTIVRLLGVGGTEKETAILGEGTLEEMRDKHRTQMKGLIMKVLDHARANQYVRFSGWSGTVANITLANQEKAILSIKTKVRVFLTPITQHLSTND